MLNYYQSLHGKHYDENYSRKSRSRYSRFLNANIKSREWEEVSKYPSVWMKFIESNGKYY
jgi:hypothetical protein